MSITNENGPRFAGKDLDLDLSADKAGLAFYTDERSYQDCCNMGNQPINTVKKCIQHVRNET